ncbi:MAG: LPS assembly lipoprotein LptE [Myxococcota bacterium]
MRLALFAVLACTSLLGCGYRFPDAVGSLGPGLDRIQIQPFENRSKEPGIERVFADALVEEFTRRGQLAPVYSSTLDGGLRLGGVIQEADVLPTAFSSVALALEYEFRIEVDLDLTRGDEEAPLWEAYRVALRERFLESPEPGVHLSNKEEALQRMAVELAGRVHDVLFQTF